MKIFVSYSRRDAGDFANQIQRHLSTFKYDIFTDVEDIKAGEVWNNTIEENISSCDIFVVIVTYGALHSSHVEKEVLQAQKENKKIIPCFFKNINPNKIKWGLEKIQGLEFTNEYQLARDLYSKIDIETNILSDKDTESNIKTNSKTVEEIKTDAPSTTIKSDTAIHQKKDTLQPSNVSIGAINGNGVQSPPKYTAPEYSKNQKKDPERYSSSRQSQGINLKLIIIPIIAVVIIGSTVSVSYFNAPFIYISIIAVAIIAVAIIGSIVSVSYFNAPSSPGIEQVTPNTTNTVLAPKVVTPAPSDNITKDIMAIIENQIVKSDTNSLVNNLDQNQLIELISSEISQLRTFDKNKITQALFDLTQATAAKGGNVMKNLRQIGTIILQNPSDPLIDRIIGLAQTK